MAERYVPEYPSEISAEYLYRELLRLSQVLEVVQNGRLEVTYVEPDKSRQGDIRYADGTQWDPGSGEGIYRFDGSAWNFLG